MFEYRSTALRRRSVANALATLLLVTVLAVLGAILVARATGHAVLIDRSDSMRPAIAAGDLLITRTVSPAQIERNDIVTFTDPDQPGRTITHRVVERHRNGGQYAFVTRGDANTGTERWSVAAAGTVGRLALVMPRAGRPLAALGSPALRLVLITFAGLLLGGTLLRRVWAV
jgi:signal peptidase